MNHNPNFLNPANHKRDQSLPFRPQPGLHRRPELRIRPPSSRPSTTARRTFSRPPWAPAKTRFRAAEFAYGKDKGLVMGYFDGNTVTALWNYAQHFAMSDNTYGTMSGPSTPGALNLSRADQRRHRGHVRCGRAEIGGRWFDVDGGTMNGELDPSTTILDLCRTQPARSPAATSVTSSPRRASRGDGSRGASTSRATNPCSSSHRLESFDRAMSASSGPTRCDRLRAAPAALPVLRLDGEPDAIPPTSVAMVGKTDRANHQYDIA